MTVVHKEYLEYIEYMIQEIKGDHKLISSLAAYSLESHADNPVCCYKCIVKLVRDKNYEESLITSVNLHMPWYCRYCGSLLDYILSYNELDILRGELDILEKSDLTREDNRYRLIKVLSCEASYYKFCVEFINGASLLPTSERDSEILTRLGKLIIPDFPWEFL